MGIAQQRQFDIPIRQFIQQQQSSAAIADPLLNFTDAANGPCKPLIDYCDRHGITHVRGVYRFTDEFIRQAQTMKDNAHRLAKIASTCLAMAKTSTQIDSSKPRPADPVPTPKSPRAELMAVLQKCKLDPADVDNVKVREQALRRLAGFSDTPTDLEVVLSSGIHIDAQDDRIKKNTALHCALENKKWNNAKFLISHGARIDIPNATGIKAENIIAQLPEPLRDELIPLICESSQK